MTIYKDPTELILDNGKYLILRSSLLSIADNELRIKKTILATRLKWEFIDNIRKGKWGRNREPSDVLENTMNDILCNYRAADELAMKDAVLFFHDHSFTYLVEFISHVLKTELYEVYERISEIVEDCECECDNNPETDLNKLVINRVQNEIIIDILDRILTEAEKNERTTEGQAANPEG